MAKKNMDFVPIRQTKKNHNLIIRNVARHETIPKKFSLSLPKAKKRIFVLVMAMLIMAVLFASYQLYFREKWFELNYKWGMENLAKGNFDKAAKNFETATAGKNEAEAIYKLAVSKYNQKDYSGAVEAYKEVIAKDPGNSAAYNGLGNLYRDEKNYEAAKDYYKKAVEAGNSYVIAYSNWAIMLMDNGKIEEAKKVISEGIEKNPGNLELQNLKKIIEE
jgi:tetratricopeptide (TPR) repeat protein